MLRRGSSESRDGEEQVSGLKRKSDAAGENSPHPQPRAKRNRYISIACIFELCPKDVGIEADLADSNECKRRKIKCNGNTPCQRCGHLNLDCTYAPNCCSSFRESQEFRSMNAQIAALQQQLDSVSASVNTLNQRVDSKLSNDSRSAPVMLQETSFGVPPMGDLRPTPSSSEDHARSAQPRFHGPTSTEFNIGVAKSSLQTMGITTSGGASDDEDVVREDGLTPPMSPHPKMPQRSISIMNRQLLAGGITSPLQSAPVTAADGDQSAACHATKDPIWMLSKDEAVRLVHVWQDEMGEMYPVIDFPALLRHTQGLYTFMEAASRTGLVRTDLRGADAITDEKTTLLKVILATALTLEGGGRSEVGRRMFQSVRAITEGLLLASADIRGVSMLALVAMYHFHRDDETLSWRVLGLAARMAVELGLHQNDTYKQSFQDDQERSQALNLFWSIYVLDRRWSFGTGMSFALHDRDIDPSLPKPNQESTYLACLVTYSILGSKVWKSVANIDSARGSINQEDMEFLDYQVVRWHRDLPEPLQYPPPSRIDLNNTASRGHYRRRAVLYLRMNQMRILLYRPVLHSATSIVSNLRSAEKVVEVARDTVRTLTDINRTSDVYRTQQVMFNYFLVSALAVLFLAVSHAPAQFSCRCRDEFYMALDLVRGLSADSFVSKRLWRTIRTLKEVAPKLGLDARPSSSRTPETATSSRDQLNPFSPDAAGVEAGALPTISDAHSSAAIAMAGLAGHPVDELNAIACQTSMAAPAPSGNSPNGMANDLTNLFENAMTYPTVVPPSNEYEVSGVGEVDMRNSSMTPRTTAEALAGVHAGNNLASIMGGLF